MATKFKVKRSTVSGVTPTTGDIDTAELAINLPDRKLFTSNGTAVYELGSNLTNLSVSANLNIGASGDLIIASGAGISANGGFGTAGHVLHSNGTAAYWAADDNSGGTITQVSTGNGLTGGPITTTGTVSVLANSGIVANTTGVFVNANTGTVANSSGLFVNSTYIGTLSANNTTYLNGQLASYYTNATNISTGTLANARLPSAIDVTSVNATSFGVTGTTIFSNSSLARTLATFIIPGAASEGGQLVLGYGNGLATSISGQANNTFNIDVVGGNTGSTPVLRIFAQNGDGSTTSILSAANTGRVHIGSTSEQTDSTFKVTGTANISGAVAIGGITTFNANVVLGSSGLSANGGFGSAGQVLHSNGTAAYWAADDNTGGTVTQVSTGNGLTGGPITTTGTVSVLANSGIIANTTGVFVNANTGIVANSTGVFVNSTYISTLSANNTTYLNGQLASYYTNATNITTGTLPWAQAPTGTVNTSGSFTFSGVETFNANVVIGTAAGLSANGGFGTAGQFLTSNGTGVYWSTATASVNTAAQFAWTNTHTFAANVTFDTDTLFVDATNDEVGIGTTTPSAKLDIVGASNIRAFETTSTISNTVATTYANFLDVNISGSDVIASDIIHAGFVVDVDSVATSGNTTAEHIIYGIWGTADVTGPSNRIYGLYSDVRANNSVGTIGQLYGNYNLVEPDPVTGGTISDVAGTFNLVTSGGNGAVTTMFGTYNRTLLETTGTPTLTNGYGSYNEIEIDGNAISNAYATRSVIDIDGGTITNGYLYYGDYQGGNTTNPTNSYGLYLTGERQNYLSGNVGIGNTAPNAKLQVTGTANVSGNVVVGGALTSANLTTTTNTITIGTASYFVSNGNVGISNSTPTIKLTVEGDLSAYFHLNPTTINSNYTIPANYNAMVAGPITVANGVTVTVSSGSTWVIT